MIDESALIARLEGANTEELVHLILTCTVEEEKTLRIYLGDTRFRRLRNLVLRREMVRDERREHGRLNVVFIPGTLGCELTSIDHQQNSERVWLSPNHLVAGQLARLRLAAGGLADASSEYTIRVTGVMKRYYGEVMLALAEYHNAYAFWYDWRKDMRLAAAQLQARINNWFPAGEPVHLVAHAGGGLVARAYIHQFSDWWDRGDSKLIMIGTPNYGVYTIPQAFTGHLGLIQGIDLLDTQHDRTEFRDIVKSFPGLYQLLPAPLDPNLELLYQADSYGQELNVQQEYLDSARGFHEMLTKSVVDSERMIYIAGHNQATFVGVNASAVQNFAATRVPDANEELDYITKTYELGLNGDGTVAHHMGVLKTEDHDYIPAYYVEALHGDLCSHPKVLLALQQLLVGRNGPSEGDATLSGLRRLTPDLIENRRSAEVAEQWQDSNIRGTMDRDSEARKTFETLVRRVNSRRDLSATRHLMTVEERDIEERLTYGFLSGETDRSQMTYRSIELSIPKIKIRIISADITDNELRIADGMQPIDALAIGHYSGSKPHGVLRTLDYKISRALKQESTSDCDENEYEDLPSTAAAEADDKDLLVTQFTQRGTIRAELAQMFFLIDPRDASRVITIAGMGEPGRFGAPELTVLVRELCWSLGRMGKKHLATVLIGVGRDNLSVTEAVSSWVRGLKLAITGMAGSENEDGRVCVLEDITFFVTDPRKILIFDDVLRQEKRLLGQQRRMEIDYVKLTPAERDDYKSKTFAYVRKQMERQLKGRSNTLPSDDVAPTRITVSVEGTAYHFGAITNSASIPEREVPLDPALVDRANDELAAETNPDRQLDLGEFMQRLLFPADLRGLLSTNAPLVMMLDNKTARIHWELLAQSDIAGELADDAPQEDPHLRFLGTSRGFTRQLRTIYAPPPEPPPSAERHLRVLVVVDPAEDAHLPGAEQEGVAVADLFEQFNIVHANSAVRNRVEVVRLFGPREATRTTVLRHLMMRTYDVLHFAGHCVYDKENPAASGWIFSNGERLSAYEFTRIDRSPGFVFSNACESGVTPARSDERSVDLAPSFAESFFARGVANFVCTAWPVDDRAARDFALALYAGLLGLQSVQDEDHARRRHFESYRVLTPLSMHDAMMQARRAIATPPSDTRTWGAYQHYGNPYFRFFDPVGFPTSPAQMKIQPAENTQPDRAESNTAQDPSVTDALQDVPPASERTTSTDQKTSQSTSKRPSTSKRSSKKKRKSS